jgi:serpin B
VSNRKNYYIVTAVLVLILATSVMSYLKDQQEEEYIPIEFSALLDLTDDEAVEAQIVFYLVNRDSEPDVVKVVNFDTVYSEYKISITLQDIRDSIVFENQTSASKVRFFTASYVDNSKPTIETHLTGWINENKHVQEWDELSIQWVNATGNHGGPWIPRDFVKPASSTVEGSNDFAFELYDVLRVGDGNILFSPYSISTALSMVYEGARGETAEEMQNVLHVNPDEAERLSENDELYNAINMPQGCELDTANALWLQNDYPVEEAYKTKLTEYYHSEVKQLDFYSHPEEARVTINNWVETQTHEKIKDLFPEGSIDPAVRLVLTNAVYFKGKWLHAFNPDRTKSMPFYPEDGETISVGVDMMQLIDERFNYTVVDDAQILELPYMNSSLSMVLVLPLNKTLAELEDTINNDQLFKWLSYLREQEVKIYLPRFGYESKYDMNTPLSEMGIQKLFIPEEADLTGINPDEELYVGKVIHQAYIDVNEEGTEAAAATGVTVRAFGGSMTDVFKADHPFLYLIMDKQTGSILFMGRVIDPNLS